MTREELISQCRYYKGEETCPLETGKDDKPLIWFYESKWVQFVPAGDYVIEDYLRMYIEAGLADFHKDEGIPQSLMALLFARFCCWGSGTTDGEAPYFKEWFDKNY